MRFFPFILALVLAACSGDKEEKTDKKKSLPPPTIAESRLVEFTGARTKLAWTQYQNPDKVDKQGTSRHHFLFALDTADGRGAHKVLDARANYAYPIITPDGERIVFTRKEKISKGSKRTFKPTIEIVNFDGSGLEKLGKGYAQEVWEDPETGKYWIYAGDNFVLAGGTAPICERIIRFPLEDPSKREVVWDRTQMGTDSFAISADGKRFAGLFPWPKAGLGNLETDDWEPLTNGCWVSMAPDNSYRSWVFDGPHKNLIMFDANAKQTAKIPVNNHPKLKGKEVYHPRWGNHNRYFVVSGPHTRDKGKRRRGDLVEIFLGRFSPEFDRVESWFQITDNGLPDIYPDIWIEGASKPTIAKKSDPPPVKPKSNKWPSSPDGLVFKWENVRAKNEFTTPDGSNQLTKLEPKGLARYGRHYDMDLSGGTFEPVLGSEAQLKASLETGSINFQALVTANANGGEILQAGKFRLHLQRRTSNGREFSQLLLEHGPGTFVDLGEFPLNEPTHLAVSFAPEKEDGAFINGAPVQTHRMAESSISRFPPRFRFGGGFDGRVEHVAFYNRAITADEAAADYALIRAKLDQRKPVERINVKGKLVAMSPMPTLESIEPYLRALVYYAYETDHPDPQNKLIAVTHWAILDQKTVGGMPREIGKTYDLTLEPFFEHPELSSQAESRDEDAIDILLQLYHDVTTPQKPD